VAREQVRGPQALLEGGTQAAPVTAIPLEVNRELLQLGRSRFQIFCAACHGILGDGDSIVARDMSLLPPPNLLKPPHVHGLPGLHYRIITYGYGLMAPYAAELDVRERWAVVAYLKALQRSQNARLSDVPPELRASLDEPQRREATPEPPNRAHPGTSPIEKREAR
jgi:mono/diheme cytochrome c family protein